MPHETQFGLTDHAGTPRPRAAVLADLAATLRHLDLDAYAGEGPVTGAALLVPHEYVHPYDRGRTDCRARRPGTTSPPSRPGRPTAM